jgi:flagellar hook capping protein FlgD
VTLLVRITFAVLVAATVAAFFVTQRLKRSPAIVAGARFGPEAFSPDGNGHYDRARIRFRLRKADDVTVAVVDEGGDVVRTLRTAAPVPAHATRRLTWNGRADDGRRAPDGYYRARLGLRHQGRTVTVPGVVRLDTEPPTPVVTSVEGHGARGAHTPLFLTYGRVTPLTVRFTGSTLRHSELLVERTDGRAPRVVARTRAAPRRHTLHWDGTVDGRAPAPGVYRLRVEVYDLAGNLGHSPGRGTGVTVRAVAVEPPLVPVVAGRRATFYVDARRRAYRWTLRRVGGGVEAAGRGRGPRLRVRVPGGRSGAYELTVGANAHHTTVPFAVRDPSRRRVLVVLPALRWLGSDPVDDDGDGVPNTLDRGQPAPLRRVLAGLPAGFRAGEGRLLAHLDRRVRRYDLTTDAALALGRGPRPAGHRGVLVAGQETWLPRSLAAELRRWVHGGGTLATFSVHSMRRAVRLRDETLSAPSPLKAVDALGSRLGPIVHRPGDLTAFPPDGPGLFAATDGLFAHVDAYETTRGLPGGRPEAAAGPDPRTPVILAYALGRGRVIRAGVADWTARLGSDPSVTGVTDRAWTLLSR